MIPSVSRKPEQSPGRTLESISLMKCSASVERGEAEAATPPSSGAAAIDLRRQASMEA